MQFSNFDIDHFLAEHWQKKPLLIRNPWTEWRNPVTPDELGGLACEDHIESRLITQSQEAEHHNWEAENGPLPEDRFSQLHKAPWTLLVQAVDQIVPDVAALITPFRFIPDWRIDDVMVSYASDGGGVGPHFDHYDVFLIQGLGRRRWQLGGRCDDSTELLPHDHLRLLARFDVQDEWVLEAGDILYVPPGIAHNGVAIGDDCMTYSIGFRAPSRGELIADWSDDLIAGMRDDDRYADPGLSAQDNPGEITPAAIARLHNMLTEKLNDRAAFTRWFGRYNSTPKYPDIEWQPEIPLASHTIKQHLSDGKMLIRNPASRYAFVRHDADNVLLFVDGECFECAAEASQLAQKICAQDHALIDLQSITSDDALQFIASLYNQGSLFWASEME